MGIASHLGPWLLGTVKNTTGTTAGTVRNMGATSVSQSVPLVAGSAVTLWLPAGSQILDAFTLMTTAAAGTPSLTVDGVSIGTVSTAALGKNSLVSAATANAANEMNNVGSVDVQLSYTATAATAGFLVVSYVVRNADGTYNPTAFTA